MICTETYYRRVIGGERNRARGQGVRWEGNLISNHIYGDDSDNSRFIPVLFGDGKPEHIPDPLRGVTRYCVDTDEGHQGYEAALPSPHRSAVRGRKGELGR